jgi:hypothetical protein
MDIRYIKLKGGGMGLGSFAKTKRNTELQGETDREFTSERWMECFGDRGI